MNFYKRINELDNVYKNISEEDNNNLIKGIVHLLILVVLGLFLSVAFSNVLILGGIFLLGISIFGYRLNKINKNLDKREVIIKEKGIVLDIVEDNVKKNYLANRIDNLSLEELRVLKDIICNYELIDVGNMLIDNDMIDILFSKNEDMKREIIDKDVYEIDDNRLDLDIPNKFISDKKRVRKISSFEKNV